MISCYKISDYILRKKWELYGRKEKSVRSPYESYSKMGKRKLAYEIKKQQEGIYEVINFESKPEAIAELERIYRITDDIMKYIIVKKG